VLFFFLESPAISTNNVEITAISESFPLSEITQIYVSISLQKGLTCKAWLLFLVLALGKQRLLDEHSEPRTAEERAKGTRLDTQALRDG
jgi:hypothetical protein